MKPISDLRRKLLSIDGKLYAAYREIMGEYETATLRVIIDHIQNDPFSTATRIRVLINQKWAKFPSAIIEDTDKQLATRDFITRQLSYEMAKFSKTRGTGKSGEYYIPSPSPVILSRSSVLYHQEEKDFEARIFTGLPASGKHITGHIAADILTQEIPRIIEKCFIYPSLNQRLLQKHLNAHADARFVRGWLKEKEMTAFIAENSIIPRKPDGIGADNKAQPFSADEGSYTTLRLPNRGEVRGIAIPRGLTVISGPPSSGKSELISGIQQGIYNHIPGDGRGLVITRGEATTVHSEPDRSYSGLDLSLFGANFNRKISAANLHPGLKAKTSQMANLVELLEAGCKTLLFDENMLTPEFLYSPESEKEKSLYQIIPQLISAGISIIIATRAFPAFEDIANQVLRVNENHEWQMEIRAETGKGDIPELKIPQRSPNPRTINPRKGNKAVSISSRTGMSLAFGSNEVGFSRLENLVEAGQLDAIGQAINYAKKNLMGENYALRNIASRVVSDINSRGWDIIDGRKMGIYSEFRPLDFTMVLNRLPEIEME
jgi:predicted ABC-class ATPase